MVHRDGAPASQPRPLPSFQQFGFADGCDFPYVSAAWAPASELVFLVKLESVCPFSSLNLSSTPFPLPPLRPLGVRHCGTGHRGFGKHCLLCPGIVRGGRSPSSLALSSAGPGFPVMTVFLQVLCSRFPCGSFSDLPRPPRLSSVTPPTVSYVTCSRRPLHAAEVLTPPRARGRGSVDTVADLLDVIPDTQQRLWSAWQVVKLLVDQLDPGGAPF